MSNIFKHDRLLPIAALLPALRLIRVVLSFRLLRIPGLIGRLGCVTESTGIVPRPTTSANTALLRLGTYATRSASSTVGLVRARTIGFIVFRRARNNSSCRTRPSLRSTR